MNEATALGFPLAGSAGLADLLGILALPSRKSSRSELTQRANEIFQNFSEVVEEFLIRAISARTKEEFVDVRNQIFNHYFNVHQSLGGLARVLVTRDALEVLAAQSFAESEAEFRELGLEQFGTAARDQAIFTVWSLRRINALIWKISSSAELPSRLQEKDRELARDFSLYAIWCRFHLDCLSTAMKFNKPITPEVLDQIQDGLRSAVNAYGIARQGVRLRENADEVEVVGTWDEEDQELVAASMRDMEAEIL